MVAHCLHQFPTTLLVSCCSFACRTDHILQFGIMFFFFHSDLIHHIEDYVNVRGCAERKQQKANKTLTNMHWVLNVPPAFHIYDLANLATLVVTGGQTLTSTALAVNTTYRWGGAYSEGIDFGRCEWKVSRVGAAATSSVRSFPSLIMLGKKNFLWSVRH